MWPSGVSSLASDTTNYNTAVGYATMSEDTYGESNVALGYVALDLNKSGSDDTATGANCLYTNSTGSYNVANGFEALFMDNGSFNTSIGALSMNVSTGASNSTAIGYSALYSAKGTNNIAVGYDAGDKIGSGSNNIDIGNPGVSTDSNAIRIGDENTSDTTAVTTIAGIYGITLPEEARYVVVDADGRLGTASSVGITSISPGKMNADLARLEERNTKLEATVAEQAKTLSQQQKDFQAALAQINSLTATLKEQESLLQKVSAQMQVMRSGPQVVSNNN